MTGYERVLFLVPGRTLTGAREKRGDRAAICQMRTMAIVI
jgi:hypothetical protein